MFKVLNDITLINANNINPKLSVNVLNFCSKLIKFNKTILFCDKVPENITSNINHVSLKINSLSDYNEFILKKLNDYVDTSHCLVVQNDGFIINPHLWQDEFLKYDYIGAPWNLNGMRVWKRTNRIGNGGFSLRSKKFMQFVQQKVQAHPHKYLVEPEDVVCSRLLELNNFKYPSVEVAAKFSLEDPQEDVPFNVHESFGFHGKLIYNNLLKLCPNVLKLKQKKINETYNI